MGSYVLILVILAIFIYFAYNQDKLPSWMKRSKDKCDDKEETDSDHTDTDTIADDYDNRQSGCKGSKHAKK